ncbi:MAG: hypothetical protein HUU02_09780 [Bacteroidetes bacterium]|nr:hypothetical protein [Bacteroidota bacterium]
MPKLFVEDLAPDMVLERPITDQYGLVLFQQGMVLTARSINTLRMWGITEVCIEPSSINDATVPASILDPAAVAAAQEITEELFRNTSSRSGPFVRELMRHVAHRIAKQRSEEAAHAG